ncbi:3-phosphoshikimate 1-carboxyvinyltransferase [Jejudonia soesokkakensis]|uniref:3-phosphoshikimate 1-carboxyvinyltransferase n=1 Tax=Jejudonia soesokkakensis TaxID=1323432 RepID=A0ABW2MSI3_9FLAO
MSSLQLSYQKPRNLLSEINITGSKSESNRLLILQALFPQLKINNCSKSDDSEVMKEALQKSKGSIDIHHAGTAMRFLTAFFAVKEEAEVILTGSERMQQRPIGILVDALRILGADIQYVKEEGFPPLRINGKTILKSEVEIDANVSSQYISALLLIAPSLQNGLTINLKGKTTSKPYLQMTVDLLSQIGVKAKFHANSIWVATAQKIDTQTITVESDWSSASYFYSIVALSSQLSVKLISYKAESLQGDSALVTIYKKLGVQTEFMAAENSIILSKSNKTLSNNSLLLDLSDTPDIAQTIAVTCFGLGLSCKLLGLHTLKIKETDRLIALKTELEKLGASVSVTEETLQLKASETTKNFQNTAIDTYSDHRMAMAFAPLAICDRIVINEAEVVSKSFPDFWKSIQEVGIFSEIK